jgi:hypothetical protein
VLLACQIVFHVSTELPYSTKEEQQVLRKRHIGTRWLPCLHTIAQHWACIAQDGSLTEDTYA